MAKAPAAPADSAILRAIPSMDRILSTPAFERLSNEFGREHVKAAIAEHLATLRATRAPFDEDDARAMVREILTNATRSTLRRTINATGILIHTNLGRSPIDATIWSEAMEIVAGYSNLEFDLDSGERGARDEHLTSLCRTLFGCEAAILTNNNAAGTMLVLASVAAGKEVVVSRGELVEIGGSFRVPDVIQQGGAKLREVGTTNRTRARDYADAITRRTAAILRVHRSNFDIVGFTETPEIGELVDVARTKKVPLLYDEGSGCIVDLHRYGFAPKTRIAELIAQGVDVVTCSTDKLMGATQGGLILGCEKEVEKCRRHPLMRALRVGKETYAVVAATLRAFAAAKHEERVPIYRMLATPIEVLRRRGEMLIAGTRCTLVDSDCALGGGTTPTETIPSIAIEEPGNAESLHARFLANDPPIVGRIRNDRFMLDLRTLLETDLSNVKAALA
ncbi:MAG TPA: L-seryl-tRNA(Sec) selenium transferase [Thermoanaerobaculia bacterium]|nr:L-seryl-tRNA(Sec) selenium transferase [Thermoanaerobaculia bacterium]